MTTWNPADKDADVTLSGGDLTAASARRPERRLAAFAGQTSRRAESITSKFCTPRHRRLPPPLGFARDPTPSPIRAWGLVAGNTSFSGNGFIAQDGSLGTITTGLVNGDYVGVAVDIGNGLCYFSINGTFVDGSDPVGGSGGFTLPAGNMYPAWGSSEANLIRGIA